MLLRRGKTRECSASRKGLVPLLICMTLESAVEEQEEKQRMQKRCLQCRVYRMCRLTMVGGLFCVCVFKFLDQMPWCLKTSTTLLFSPICFCQRLEHYGAIISEGRHAAQCTETIKHMGECPSQCSIRYWRLHQYNPAGSDCTKGSCTVCGSPPPPSSTQSPTPLPCSGEGSVGGGG